jgi:hypothetical protein
LTDLTQKIRTLDSVSAYQYFKARQMPDFIEPIVVEILQDYIANSDSWRSSLRSHLTQTAAQKFGWYARRTAGQAVRESSTHHLKEAALAIALDAEIEDYRDLVPTLALLCNSAVRLQHDPASLFASAFQLSSPRVARLLADFASLPSDRRDIRKFGFHEGVGPHGFDYIPLLAEFGGPSPF